MCVAIGARVYVFDAGVICLHVNVRNVCVSLDEQVWGKQSRSHLSLHRIPLSSPHFLLFLSFCCLLQDY